MPRKWTTEEFAAHKKTLTELYVVKNLSIKEIGVLLTISEKTVFKRLCKCNIRSRRVYKKGYLNKRSDISVPAKETEKLAEILGIVFGDGHISQYQLVITLSAMESAYAQYVQRLLKLGFGVAPKIATRNDGHICIYIGSVDLVRWFTKQGLKNNKTKSSVAVPEWLFSSPRFMQAFIRGFFDTDGSIYQLKHGLQISLTSFTPSILKALHYMLIRLEYSPSLISGNKIYLTRKKDISTFFKDIQPRNAKHCVRYKNFMRVGTQVVNEDRL